MEQLKSEYSQFQEKYSLPSYEELDNEFELLNIKPTVELPKTLTFIRRRMYDKLGWVCATFQGIIQPNTGSMLSVQESSFISKEEKQDDLLKIVKELMHYARLSLYLDLEYSEEQEIKFIKDFYKAWMENKPKIKTIYQKVADGWKNEEESKPKSTNNYLG